MRESGAAAPASAIASAAAADDSGAGAASSSVRVDSDIVATRAWCFAAALGSVHRAIGHARFAAPPADPIGRSRVDPLLRGWPRKIRREGGRIWKQSIQIAQRYEP